MKRCVILLLVLCLMLCACGKDKKNPATPTHDVQTQDPKETTPPTTTPTPSAQPQTPTEITPPATTPTPPVQSQTPEDTTPPDTPPTPPAQPEPPEETTPPATTPTPPASPEVLAYRHPLNGTPIATPWSGQVTAVVINNLKNALPQAGISSADIFYEVEAEAGHTRCLAVFSDISKATAIGPVRSTRTYFNSLAASYDAPIIYCGGSTGLGLDGKYDKTGTVIPNWEHINQQNNSTYFYRDMNRYMAGYPWEHCLFTSSEKIQQALKDHHYDTPETKSYGLSFAENVKLNGETANEVTVKFKGDKTTTLKYDAASGQYSVYQHEQDMLDSSNNNQIVTFKNVIAIYTNQEYAPDNLHIFYDTITSGDAYAAINGKIVPIKWNRASVDAPFTYTLENGEPLTLDVGSTYVALVGIQHPISYK